MKGWQWAVIAGIVVAVLIGTGLVQVPNYNVQYQQPTQQPQVTVTVGPSGQQQFGFQPGDFIDDVLAYDSFSASTAYTLATVSTVVWYREANNVYTTIGSGTGGTLQVPADSNGYVYAAVKGESTYYINAWKMKSDDSKIVSMSYWDIDGQSPKEFVFKVSLASVTRQSGYTPHFSFTVWILVYQVPTASDVSDTVVTVGSSAIDKYFEFYTTQTTLNRAYAIYKIDFIIEKCLGTYSPQSDSAKIVYMKVQIPGKGYIDITSSMSIRSYDLLYSYTLGTDLGDSWYIKTSANDVNKQYYNLNIRVALSSGDEEYRICWTLYYLIPGASGVHSAATISDNVFIDDA